MSILIGHRKNFETLLRAAADGKLCLVECKDAKTGEYRAVIAAVSRTNDDWVQFAPFGHMAEGNPYVDYVDPVTSMEQDEEKLQ